MAHCPSCGHQVSEAAVTCPNCGHPLGGRAAGENTQGAVASLVLGIVSFVIWPVGIVTAPLAIIFGNKAKREARANPGTGGEGMATAGRILGWVWGGLALLIIAIIVITVAVGGRTTSSTFSCTVSAISSQSGGC